MKNFFLVMLNLMGELWIGFFNRKPDFYDKYTVTKTKAGYFIFIILSVAVIIGIMILLYGRFTL